MVRFFGGGGCKDPSHILFSTFIYPYLLSSFSPFTAIISGCTLLFTSGNRQDSDKCLSRFKIEIISIITVRIAYRQLMLEKGR
jgi:hypothetical protein